jgi:pyruvyl transferase EpsI
MRRFFGTLPLRPVCTAHVKALKASPGRRFFLLGTPPHGNLGDQAIAYAEQEFICDLFPDIPVAELTDEVVRYASAGALKKAVKPDDVLLLHGGGNIGTIWPGADRARYRILWLFPKNKTVLFPQSVFFENTPGGRRALRVSKKRYAKHPDFHMAARDTVSHEIMSALYPRVVLTPDIVLYLDKQEPKRQRDGALLVFRGDAERHISDREALTMQNLLASYTKNLRFTDTVINCPVPPAERKSRVEAKLDEFRRAKLVVTDRLHGMVFAAVTATPCIVLPNSYHKIEGLYAWLRNLPYIRFITDVTEAKAHIDELWHIAAVYDPNPLKEKFAPLAQLLTTLT